MRRKAVIGSVQQYPNVEDAWEASNGLRISINEARNRQREQAITVADLVDHYIKTELAGDPGGGAKSHATRIVYKEVLARWVRPALGDLNIRAVRTTAVEHWLRRLMRLDGSPMAPSTKAKIRNVMSVLFNHAIRYEWLEQGRNPILLVRQSAKRQRIPEFLEPEELRALLSQLPQRFRAMVLLDVSTGLRRSELFALKWEDVDFVDLQINVRRSIYLTVVGNCKTEASRKPVPMDSIFASELWAWKQESPYRQPNDWVRELSYAREASLLAGYRPFTRHSPRCGACRDSEAHRLAHVSSQLFYDVGGKRGELEGRAGTHAARNCRCTLEIYSQARTQAKREAQHRVVEMILPHEQGASGRAEVSSVAKSDATRAGYL